MRRSRKVIVIATCSHVNLLRKNSSIKATVIYALSNIAYFYRLKEIRHVLRIGKECYFGCLSINLLCAKLHTQNSIFQIPCQACKTGLFLLVPRSTSPARNAALCTACNQQNVHVSILQLYQLIPTLPTRAIALSCRPTQAKTSHRQRPTLARSAQGWPSPTTNARIEPAFPVDHNISPSCHTTEQNVVGYCALVFDGSFSAKTSEIFRFKLCCILSTHSFFGICLLNSSFVMPQKNGKYDLCRTVLY